MSAAIALAERLDAEAIRAMHAALLVESRPEIAGRWREEPVWIGGSDYRPHDALFVPPRHDHVPGAIDDLLAFIDRDDIPILAPAAVAHAQFETVHPFADGNGRTGRAPVHAQLRNKRLARNVTGPVSAGLLTDTDAYFAALTTYRNDDLVTIVEQFTTAAFGALTNGRHLVDDLRSIRTEWTDRIRARRDSGTWKIADVLLNHPVVNAAFLADELAVASQNTCRSLARLFEAEVVVEFTDRVRSAHGGITRYCSVVASACAIRDNRALWDGRSLNDWVPDLANVIVLAFDTREIILFGSVAEGTDGPDSDIDLLVVLDQAPLADRRRLMVDLRKASRSIAAPVDLLVTSVEDFERNGSVPGTTEFEPATNGTVIYERGVS